MTLGDRFPPLQATIVQAESWSKYLSTRSSQANHRGHETVHPGNENMVWAGVHLGESLPLMWRLTFENLFRVGDTWMSVQEFEAIRQGAQYASGAIVIESHLTRTNNRRIA